MKIEKLMQKLECFVRDKSMSIVVEKVGMMKDFVLKKEGVVFTG